MKSTSLCGFLQCFVTFSYIYMFCSENCFHKPSICVHRLGRETQAFSSRNTFVYFNPLIFYIGYVKTWRQVGVFREFSGAVSLVVVSNYGRIRCINSDTIAVLSKRWYAYGLLVVGEEIL